MQIFQPEKPNCQKTQPKIKFQQKKKPNTNQEPKTNQAKERRENVKARQKRSLLSAQLVFCSPPFSCFELTDSGIRGNGEFQELK
jgi:hypothetical protein